jgi:hypothetical protein
VLRSGDYIQIPKNYLVAPNDWTNAAWVKRGGVTVTAGQPSPEGANAATQLHVGNATTNDLYQSVSGLAASATLSPRIYLKRISSTGTVGLRHSAGVQCGQWLINLAALSSGWEAINRSHPAVTVITEFVTTATGIGGLWLTSDTIGSYLDFYVWSASLVTPSVNAHLHKVMKDATSDVTGGVTLDLFPRLRESVADFTPIIYTNPVGIWRLNANRSSWQKDNAGFYTISFSAVEAL